MTLQEKIEKLQAELDQLKEEAKSEEILSGSFIVAVGSTKPDKVRRTVKAWTVSGDDRLFWTEQNEDYTHHYSKEFCRKATHKEIEKHLIVEAEKKGFVKGATVSFKRGAKIKYCKDVGYNTIQGLANSLSEICDYHIFDNILFLEVGGDHHLFIDISGVELLSNRIRVGGHEVNFHSDHIEVGCTRVELETIRKIYKHYDSQ